MKTKNKTKNKTKLDELVNELVGDKEKVTKEKVTDLFSGLSGNSLPIDRRIKVAFLHGVHKRDFHQFAVLGIAFVNVPVFGAFAGDRHVADTR